MSRKSCETWGTLCGGVELQEVRGGSQRLAAEDDFGME